MRASSVLFAVLGSAAIAVALNAILLSISVLYVQRPVRGQRWAALRASFRLDRSHQYLAVLFVPFLFSCVLAIWLTRLGVPDDLGSLILPVVNGIQSAILIWMWRSDRRAEARARRPSGGSLSSPVSSDSSAEVGASAVGEAQVSSGRSDLSALLEPLLGEAFRDRAICLCEAREHEHLARDPLVRALADRVREADPAVGAALIEGFLDRLFLDYRAGCVFEHEAAVMGLLVALHVSGASWIDPIVAPLRGARSAEVAAIGRLARRLAESGVER